jgi:preprotein translocase subunit SecA
VKEGCPLTGQTEPLARITYQRFFRRYLRLTGMTGTAREVSRELRSTYGLRVVAIPTHRPSRAIAGPRRLFRSRAARWRAVVARAREMRQQGRPVLVGTGSVAASEQLSEALTAAGLPHQVLNARQDRREAELIARAGEAGCITVATHMAGRGTDIALGRGVQERGGLHVIATECGESRRVDRQLFGRCGRQGDPGSFEAMFSLEDEVLTRFAPQFAARLLKSIGSADEAIADGPAYLLVRVAQRSIERQGARLRRDLWRMDRQLNDLLAFAGTRE